MNSKPTTHQEVFDALLAMIRTAMPTVFNDTNLWLSDNPGFEVPQSARHKIFCVACPTDGQPSHGEFEGGGWQQCIEYTAATLVIHSTLRLQQTGKPGVVLTDPDVGLWVIKRKLMKALHGQHLLATEVIGQPRKSLLTQQIEYVHGERPTIQGQPVGDLALTFSLPFLWDLDT